MPEAFEKMALGKPDFSDLPHMLRRQCRVIVTDIVAGILVRRAITGGPQKRNAPSTVAQKGHDHPLIGGDKDSPQLAREGTYRIAQVSESEFRITVGRSRADVAGFVERKGYQFFGISRRADQEITRNWMRYVTGKVKDIFRG